MRNRCWRRPVSGVRDGGRDEPLAGKNLVVSVVGKEGLVGKQEVFWLVMVLVLLAVLYLMGELQGILLFVRSML